MRGGKETRAENIVLVRKNHNRGKTRLKNCETEKVKTIDHKLLTLEVKRDQSRKAPKDPKGRDTTSSKIVIMMRSGGVFTAKGVTAQVLGRVLLCFPPHFYCSCQPSSRNCNRMWRTLEVSPTSN